MKRPSRFQPPDAPLAGGGGSCCHSRWELWIQATGLLVSGSFDLDITYKAGGEVETESITVPHDVSATEFLDLINELFAVDEEEEEPPENPSGVKVVGGPLDRRSLVIGTKGSKVLDINIAENNIVSGRPYLMHKYETEDLTPDD